MGVTQYVGARYVPKFTDNPNSQWTNTVAYEPLTIVLYQGNSYTSRQAVPIGIDITNTDYWAETGNYNAQVETYRSEVHSILPYDSTPTAGSTKGVTSEGVKSAIDAETTARESADTNLESEISTLNSTVNAVVPLDTTPTAGSTKGITSGAVENALAAFTPFDTVPTAGSVKGVTSEGIRNYANSLYGNTINAISYGFDPTGATDNSDLFNELTENYNIYFPSGIYLFENPINAKHSIIGSSAKRYSFSNPSQNPHSGTVLYFNVANANLINIEAAECAITNLEIYSNDNETACISQSSTISTNSTYIKNVTLGNVYGIGIDIQSTYSRGVYIDTVTIWGTAEFVNNIGINIYSTPDCRLNNLEIMALHTGIKIYSALVQMTTAHIWGGEYRTTYTPTTDYINSLYGIDYSHGCYILLSNVYIDTYFNALHDSGSWASYVSADNLTYLNDTTYTGYTHKNFTLNETTSSCVKINSGFVRLRENEELFAYTTTPQSFKFMTSFNCQVDYNKQYVPEGLFVPRIPCKLNGTYMMRNPANEERIIYATARTNFNCVRTVTVKSFEFSTTITITSSNNDTSFAVTRTGDTTHILLQYAIANNAVYIKRTSNVNYALLYQIIADGIYFDISNLTTNIFDNFTTGNNQTLTWQDFS